MKDVAPVLTPEKVIVSYKIAGMTSRVIAQILDWLVICAGILVVSIFVAFAAGLVGEAAMGAYLVVTAATPFVYFILCEGLWNGQTLGKKAMRMRVVMADGTPVSFFAALFRNLLRPADMLPGFPFVGMMTMFLTPRFQRIGDLAVGTIVIHEPPISMQFTPAPYKYGLHPFEVHVGNLRNMTLNDYLVLKRLCDRYPFLTQETQSKMLRDIWAPFAERLKISEIPNVHSIFLMEAVVMKYGRQQELV